ncbi:outer membrane lipoprotein carrier protein LolA [Nitrosomonas sp. HPC101]|uniref:outer membrane lipoprotein chaperone LolA n=1 Tax=Nitrosomonas sp. HPC101 TaxID=1658667 RepID=UPI00136A32DD|nr:outer membrane lipoprotein chaperone LolA [Nitrosomonas sp. HPC101]MXS84878.1 outer membrane lipoprotein carrier protein LolA [Nitrosomonas sp. HPC101]
MPRLLFIFALSVCLLPLSVKASAVASLKTFVNKALTFRADFSQTLLDKNFQIVKKASGSMMFERPGKFRWTYDQPYQQLIIGDGKQVWFYDQDLAQVTVHQLDQTLGSTPAALLAGGNTIERDFNLQEIDVQGETEWLEAIPKNQENAFELIRLGFSKTGNLREMVLRDSFDQVTWLIFSATEQNPVLAPDLFQFTPPEGVDVISD